MAGFDLKEGMYEVRNTTGDELWSAFACVFSSKSRNDSSYKYGFLKAIIDNLYNVDTDLKLSFDQIFSKFGEIYWNLILKHGLRQKAAPNDSRETYLEQVFRAAVQKYKILEPIPYESLTDEMMLDVAHQVKMKCKKYVVGALFEESVAVKLLGKIDESAKRNNLTMYRKILYEEFESKTCFYCGRQLRPDKIDVDHFIPWSFIKDDNLWNLVLACPTCNRKKNDKLPAGDYLIALANRNHQIMIEMHRPEMKNYQGRMVSYVYNWAKINGYDKIWQPEGRKVSV